MRGWILGLIVCVGCSDASLRSGSLPESADFLPMATDSIDSPSAIAVDLDTLSGQQPRLILRCEAGRVGAYLVLDAQPVAVSLDSAPEC